MNLLILKTLAHFSHFPLKLTLLVTFSVLVLTLEYQYIFRLGFILPINITKITQHAHF
jgi:hypothetical protein